MLREIRNVRQIEGEPRRRWFCSAAVDLIVWYDQADEVFGFQLCYDKRFAEHALTWRKDGGYSHFAVDDGEGHGGLGYKAAPILVANGALDAEKLLRLFSEHGAQVPEEIAAMVRDKILDYHNRHSIKTS